jgi:hypothetical protein
MITCAAQTARSDAPAARYVADAETVLDRFTELTWQRSVTEMRYRTIATAKAYCRELSLAGGGWRLPAFKELLTLVDTKRKDPAIDLVAFPDAPAHTFWTTAVVVGAANRTWVVDFYEGGSFGIDLAEANHRVRCVR